MDIEGGMGTEMNKSMSQAVENAEAVVCFCTAKYQASKNCYRELKVSWILQVELILKMFYGLWLNYCKTYHLHVD